MAEALLVTLVGAALVALTATFVAECEKLEEAY